MKKLLVGIMALASVSSYASTCRILAVQEVLDGEVIMGKHFEAKRAYEAALEVGNTELAEKAKAKADKIMQLGMELADTACTEI